MSLNTTFNPTSIPLITLLYPMCYLYTYPQLITPYYPFLPPYFPSYAPLLLLVTPYYPFLPSYYLFLPLITLSIYRFTTKTNNSWPNLPTPNHSIN